ncbi:MAG TPA: 4Fe-4S binding protein [Dissulfurispiraceae bacterium]|nr:4Fe-4S binding protein [Dissulfurispiraceae bacterium]
MKRLRIISQGLFFVLFIFLFFQTESKGVDELGYPVRLFLDFDPLIFVTTLLSAHAVAVAFYLSIIMIAVTAVFGRVFCGWACPLGTLHNMAGALRKIRSSGEGKQWYRFKYYLLIFLVVSSLFTLQLVGIMDPLSLLIRSFSLSINPLFNNGVRAFFDSIYEMNVKSLADLSEAVYSMLKKSVLSFEQPYYRQGVFIGLIFFCILGLNLYQKRFWCKYLCPLGAFLGILSRYAFLKRSVGEGCNSCGLCAKVCQGNATDNPEEWKQTECIACMNCDDNCPQDAVSFGFRKPAKSLPLDLGRRRIVASMATGLIAVPLVRSNPLSKSGFSEPSLIRPPGSLSEPEFLKRCVKCGECMKVCITNGLQPTLFEAGLEGMWSPMLVPRMGYCEFRCTLCGQVCPTGAIRKLPLEEKMKVKIGLAMIDKGRCLPYAHSTPCIVCEEVCPTAKKAIWFEQAIVQNREGNKIAVKQPRVDADLCIGCGICETKCPVRGRPAIYVSSVGESRSRENQLLL